MTDTKKSYQNVLSILLEFGELMLKSGAEVNRVEDAIERLAHSYNAKKIDVYATPSNLIVTFCSSEGDIYTQARRMISSSSTDFYKLERLNSLSRDKCNGRISDEEFEEGVSDIKRTTTRHIKFYVGSMLAAGAFTLFFGGAFTEAIVAMFFALLIYLMQSKFTRFCPNTFMFNLITSFFTGLCICFVSKLFGLNADKIIVGDIMLLIPGIAFTNSIRNLLLGDTNTGVMRLVETVLWAGAIAFGFVLSMMLVGV